MTLLLIFAALIGVLLGLLGGGGSILTVPVLVYIAHLSPKNAIVTSLIVVSITSLIAVSNHARRGFVCWKTGVTFGLAGIVGAFLGGKSAAFIPDPILLVIFAIVMMSASLAMLRNQPASQLQVQLDKNFCPINLPVIPILFDGFIVGFITGLVGVGGGFLLVPALSFLAGLPMHAAIGTSLFIIVIQSWAALLGHASHLQIDFNLTVLFTVFAILGSLVGSFMANKINARYLKKGFGLFVLFLGSVILGQEINDGMIRQLSLLVQQYKEFLLGGGSAVTILLVYRLWHWLHSKRFIHPS